MIFNPLVEHAIELAAQWHDVTYRKSRWRDPAFTLPEETVLRVPVIAHVTTVAMTVQRAGWEDEVVAAAFLHDVLEDANRYGEAFRREAMRALLGEEVVALVEIVTEEKQDEAGHWRSWHDRKRDYVAQIRRGVPGAAAISLADKLHNLWSIDESLARGLDVFTPGPNRKALSAGPAEQHQFYHDVLEATTLFDDLRLVPMRTRLQQELKRFEVLTDISDA